jgi:hypothetical protein
MLAATANVLADRPYIVCGERIHRCEVVVERAYAGAGDISPLSAVPVKYQSAPASARVPGVPHRPDVVGGDSFYIM